jgi:hypothetical protein
METTRDSKRKNEGAGRACTCSFEDEQTSKHRAVSEVTKKQTHNNIVKDGEREAKRDREKQRERRRERTRERERQRQRQIDRQTDRQRRERRRG